MINSPPLKRMQRTAQRVLRREVLHIERLVDGIGSDLGLVDNSLSAGRCSRSDERVAE